jgi:LmbE family N-acetylglucosaminyl deacetylase
MPGARIDRFFGQLSQGARIAVRIAVVVAHPDDETIGIGGHLRRFADVRLVHLTQGAPDDPADAQAAGLAGKHEYAAVRAAELAAAMRFAGVAPDRCTGFGITDQQACRQLARSARRLAEFFAAWRTEIVLTHPYEGGHPDHDAAAFAVHAAAALLRDRAANAPDLVEMAFYHDGGPRLVTQRFPPDGAGGEICLALDEEDWARKEKMIVCHRSQRAVLALFRGRVERLRPAPVYDFSEPANGGRLFYERMPWHVTGRFWQKCAARALRELHLGPRL